MIGAEPMIAASVMAEAPNWFINLTFAPALISAWTRARSSLWAAHMIAVVPSGPSAFTSAPSASKRNAVARSPDSAASSNVVLPAVAALPDEKGKEHKRHKKEHKKNKSKTRNTTFCAFCVFLVPFVLLPRSC